MDEPTQAQMLWRARIMEPEAAFLAIKGADITESRGHLEPANDAARNLQNLRCTLGLILLIQKRDTEVADLREQLRTARADLVQTRLSCQRMPHEVAEHVGALAAMAENFARSYPLLPSQFSSGDAEYARLKGLRLDIEREVERFAKLGEVRG